MASGIRSVSGFHQKFPLAGKLEFTRTCLGSAGNELCQSDTLADSKHEWSVWRNGSQVAVVASTQEDFSGVVLEGNSETRYWAGPSTTEKRTASTHSSEGSSLSVSLDNVQFTHSTYSFDEYGNALSVITESDNGFHKTQTTETKVYYPHDPSIWWINKLQTQTVETRTLDRFNSAGLHIESGTDPVTWSTTTIDAYHAEHRLPSEMVTTASGASGASHTITTTYSGHGLPESVTQDGDGSASSDLMRTVTTSYSNDGYFPKEVENDKGHKTTSVISAKHGQPTSVTDPNGNTVDYTYDAFGRVTSTTVPGGQNIETGYQWCNGYCTDAPASAEYLEFTKQVGSPTVKTYKDMFNRTVMVETMGFDGSPIYSSVFYDEQGRKLFESKPSFAATVSYDSTTSKGVHYTEFDALGRLLRKKTDRENGNSYSTSYTHTGHDTSITVVDGGRSLSMSRTYGGDGKLMKTSYDNNGITDYAVTRYAYDSRGNPITLEDANGSPIHAWHNGFGHKTQVDDPNMGVKTFTYNTFGEVEQEIDANGDKLTMQYDSLGRLKQRLVNDVAQASYTYDRVPNGLGLPATESGTGIDKAFYYDEYSRPNRQVTTIDSTPYETITEYDANFGRVKAVQYPASDIKVGYAYNNYGYQTKTFNADSGFVYQEVDERDVLLNITRAFKNNNGLTEERNYSGVTGQLYTVEVKAGGDQKHFLDYDYGDFGNLSSQTVQYNNGSDYSSEFYVYDDLHRLTDSHRTFSNGHSEAPIAYGYDAVGNLTEKSDYASTLNYGSLARSTRNAGPSAVHQAVRINGKGYINYTYDNNGNLKSANAYDTNWQLLSAESKAIDYNAFNKPVSITKGNINSTFAYGADLMRFKQVKTGLPEGDETTIYLDKMVEIVEQGGSTITRTYIDDIAIISKEEIAGQPLADHKIRFTLRDRLGSVVTLTDHNNNIMEHRSYDPFGKPRTGDLMDVAVPTLREAALSDPHSGDFMDNIPFTNRGFTDHEHLDDAELIHMNGRAYDYNLGRFLSVDPFIQEPGNSQSMNPYSYIMNNPLAGTDPTGYRSRGLGSGWQNVYQYNGGGTLVIELDNGKEIKQEPAQQANQSIEETGSRVGQNNVQYASQAPSPANSNSSQSSTSGGTSGGSYWDVEYSKDNKTAYISHYDSSGNKMKGTGSFVMTLADHDLGFEYDVLEAIDYIETTGDTVFQDLVSTGYDTVFQKFKPGSCSSCGFQGGAVATQSKKTGNITISNGTISFHQFEGLRLGKETQSPSIGLAHEASHALRAITDIKGFIRDKGKLKTSGKHSSDFEEHRVIRGIETNLANSLKEPMRKWHSQGTPVKVQCATCKE